MFRMWAAIVALLVLAAACGGENVTEPSASTTTAGTIATASTAVAPLPTTEGVEEYMRISGIDVADHLGSIAVGDFTGDGAPDLALGSAMADGPDGTRTDAGEVYLFAGPFRQDAKLSASDATAVWHGADDGDGFGRAIVAGDFNGDGVDEIAVGAPTANQGAGVVYLLQYADDSRTLDLATSSAWVTLHGEDPGDTAGLVLAVGNIDGDGMADLIVGALLADGPDNTREDAGAAYAVRGRDVPGGEFSLPSAAVVITGAEAGDRLGETVSVADVTGDGVDEIVVAAPFADGERNDREAAGETYVIAGDTGNIDLATADVIVTIEGIDAGDQLGHAIAAGDVDGDGREDLWLTAVSADGAGNAVDLSGEAVVILMRDDTPSRVAAATDAASLIIGTQQDARLGRAAASGDVDGDGLSDLVVSQPGVGGRTGQLLLVRGRDTQAPTVLLQGDAAGDSLGHPSFAWPPVVVADLDGDGTPEVLGAAQDANGGHVSNSGLIVVVRFVD